MLTNNRIMYIPTYGNPLNPRMASEFERFAHLFAELDGIVLDAPCGLGRHAFHLREIGCRVASVDIEEAVIQNLGDKDKILDNGEHGLLYLHHWAVFRILRAYLSCGWRRRRVDKMQIG